MRVFLAGASGAIGRQLVPLLVHEEGRPEPPYVHVAEAARRTVELLEAPSGVVEVVED